MEYGIEIWGSNLGVEQKRMIKVLQNSAIRRILGAYRSTPVEVIEKEAALLPTDIEHQKIQLMKAIRLKYKLDRNNPLNNDLNSGRVESPINTLEIALQNISDEAIPKSFPKWRKPWAPEQTTDEEIEDEKKYRSLQKNSRMVTLQKWQEIYEKGSKGSWYRSTINGDIEKCTTKV